MKRICLLLALLAGCGAEPPVDAPRPGTEAWFDTTTPKTQAEFFAEACEVYGYRKGTDKYAQCIREEADQRHTQNRDADVRADTARRAELTKNRTTETHCTRFGDTMTCESY